MECGRCGAELALAHWSALENEYIPYCSTDRYFVCVPCALIEESCRICKEPFIPEPRGLVNIYLAFNLGGLIPLFAFVFLVFLPTNDVIVLATLAIIVWLFVVIGLTIEQQRKVVFQQKRLNESPPTTIPRAQTHKWIKFLSHIITVRTFAREEKPNLTWISDPPPGRWPYYLLITTGLFVFVLLFVFSDVLRPADMVLIAVGIAFQAPTIATFVRWLEP